MPKQQTDTLITLIHSLTKAEKRSFKLYANRLGDSDTKLFLVLFDFIDKNEEVDEEELLRKNPLIKKAQLSNIKANLYKQILLNLRHLSKNNLIDIAIRELLDNARILQSKGMLQASLFMLEKAKRMASDTDHISLVYEALSIERKIENLFVTGSTAEKADDIHYQSNSILEKIQINNDLANLSLLLYGLFLRYGYVKDEKEYNFVKEFFHSKLPKTDVYKLGFYDKIYLYQSHVWYYNMVQDFSNNFKYARKWTDLFEDQPEMRKVELSLYMKGLHNKLNATFLANRADKFLIAYQKFIALPTLSGIHFTENDVSFYELIKQIHLLNKIFLLGNYDEGVEEIKPLIADLQEDTYAWDVNRKMVFLYKIACVFFGADQYKNAIDYLNLIINSPVANIRQDIQSFARILNLIAHFELGNNLLLTYQIKSVYRFLSKMEELNSVHKEIFAFLRKTPEIKEDQLKDEFLRLRHTLARFAHDPFEKRPFLYLDIISWLDSKIQGRRIQEIIREKNKTTAISLVEN